MKYIYIDDPISSLDEHNAIKVAHDLTRLLSASHDNLRVAISTHHVLFYNVLANQLRKKVCERFFLAKGAESETYLLENWENVPPFHHLCTLLDLTKIRDSGVLNRHHFNIRAADFDEDGNLDLAVAQFGYDQGEVRWMRRTGPWSFTSEVLLDLSGAINIGVADFNGDGHLDIVALISQQWEEIYLFQNDGHGRFSRQVLWGSTNEDFGSSGLSVADVNGDGRPDLLYTNGDGFGPAVTPGPRPWHGVQWLENTGGGRFQFHRVADLPGAYSPIGVDLDQDGALDIVVTTAYLEWNNGRPLPSLVWYHNDGKNRFSARVLAHTPKDLMSVTAGDFDGSGRPSLMTGGFPVNPPFGNISRLTLWRR